jgi:hypothetical protein
MRGPPCACSRVALPSRQVGPAACRQVLAGPESPPSTAVIPRRRKRRTCLSTRRSRCCRSATTAARHRQARRFSTARSRSTRLLRPAGRGHESHVLPPAQGDREPLTSALRGAGPGTVRSFPSSLSRASSSSSQWVDEPASGKLWVTARDGEVVLTTPGDRVFERE